MFEFSDYGAEESVINYKNSETRVIEQLFLPEALTQFNMERWTHLVCNGSKPKGKISEELQQLIQASQATEKKLALTKMPDPYEGYDVVAIQPIPLGSVIIYSGDYSLFSETNAGDFYATGIPNDPRGIISAKKSGNISRFINHALSESELNQEARFSNPDAQAAVATANFKPISDFEDADFKHKHYMILRATRDILPGERIYWSYGIHYFQQLNIFPALFDKDTQQLIDRSVYYWRDVSINVEVANVGEFKVLPETVEMLITKEGYFAIEDEDIPYVLMISPHYLSMIRSQAQITSNHFNAQMSVPIGEHTEIKRFPLREKFDDVLKQTLVRIFGAQKWGEHVFKTPASTEYLQPEQVHVLSVRGRAEQIERLRQNLIEIGATDPSDFTLQNEGKTLLIFQRSVFMFTHSTIAYYKEVAKNIYAPPGEMQWKGTKDDGKLPSVWLEYPDNLEFLQQLAAYIRQHLSEEFSANIQASLSKTGIPTLLIKDARVISQDPIIPPFDGARPVLYAINPAGLWAPAASAGATAVKCPAAHY